MTNHAKSFLASRNISGSDDRVCENCGRVTVALDLDVHHIRYRSMGGTDEPENLMGCCRECHEHIHSNNISDEVLLQRVRAIINSRKK